MKVNPYFKEAEFRCKCGKCEGLPDKMPPDELIDTLLSIRAHFNSPLIIRSGYRCKEHNKKVGGASASRHLVGDAVDFIVMNVPTKKVYEFCEGLPNANNLGLAIKHNPKSEFHGFVHLDTRGFKARWIYR